MFEYTVYLPMQLTDWLHVEVALLLIRLTQFSLRKSGFNHPSVIESSLWLCTDKKEKKIFLICKEMEQLQSHI